MQQQQQGVEFGAPVPAPESPLSGRPVYTHIRGSESGRIDGSAFASVMLQMEAMSEEMETMLRDSTELKEKLTQPENQQRSSAVSCADPWWRSGRPVTSTASWEHLSKILGKS